MNGLTRGIIVGLAITAVGAFIAWKAAHGDRLMILTVGAILGYLARGFKG